MEVEEAKLNEVRNNSLISGLDEEDDEDVTATTQLVTEFFSQTMKVEENIDIKSANRIGKANPRTILVRLQNVKDKGAIFKKVSNLKEVRKSKDGPYYINNQLPPCLQERQQRFQQIMKYNAGLTGAAR